MTIIWCNKLVCRDRSGQLPMKLTKCSSNVLVSDDSSSASILSRIVVAWSYTRIYDDHLVIRNVPLHNNAQLLFGV